MSDSESISDSDSESDSGFPRRGKGWCRDVARVNVGLMQPATSAVLLPREVKIHKAVVAPIITDQSITSSCVGQMIRILAYAYLATRGLDTTIASALAAYVAARLVQGNHTLLDTGCYPRDMIDAMMKDGIVSEALWPFDPAKVNTKMPLHIVQDMATHRISQWRRIDTMDMRARIQEIKRELAFGGVDGKGVAVGFGMDVDLAYERYMGGVYERNPNNRSEGLHAQTIVGYTELDNGKTVFDVAGSWGNFMFGEAGLARIGEDTIGSPVCDDVYVAEMVPILRKAA